MVATGEAAGTPEFFQVVRDVADHIPTNDRKVDVLIPDNPTYAAAGGAAFWTQVEMDEESYCQEFYEN
ncbi:hypothetical protein SEUCBS139899_008222, partial [Sporothrix eucalyptigena]